LTAEFPVISLVHGGQIIRPDEQISDLREALAEFRQVHAHLPAGMQCMFAANLDDQLPRAITVLKQIHDQFFAHLREHMHPADTSGPVPLRARATDQTEGLVVKGPPAASVISILSDIKVTVLAGCRISFSGEKLAALGGALPLFLCRGLIAVIFLLM
jgi:hypothetical protein